MLYGRALGEAGEPARSVEQLAQAVSDAAEVFGPSSRMVGFYSVPLARFQLEMGRCEKRWRAAPGGGDHRWTHEPDSFRYAAAIHQRGAALPAARRADEALPDLTRASPHCCGCTDLYTR